MTLRIVDIREITQPINSAIRNDYIDFSKMTTSPVAVVTNVERDGRRVIGDGFDSSRHAVFEHDMMHRVLEPQAGEPSPVHQRPGRSVVVITMA